MISFEQTLKQFTGKLSLLTDQVQIEQTNRDIQNYQDAIKSTLQEIAQLELQLEWKQIETSETSDSYSSVRFVPKSLNLIDCNSFAKNQIMAHAGNISSVGIDFLPNGTFAKIQVIQDKWFNSTHQHTAVSGEEKESAIADYEKLKEIIKIFLNTSIGRTIDGEATLFGFPMGQSNLSDGQKFYFSFVLLSIVKKLLSTI